jgi:hypothetical protein
MESINSFGKASRASRQGYTPDWIRRPSKPCTRQCAAITEQRRRDKLTNFLFLPEKLKDLDQLLKETVAAFAGDAVYLAHLDTFNPFFELIVRLKKRGQIKNSAAAFLKLLELARMGRNCWGKRPCTMRRNLKGRPATG